MIPVRETSSFCLLDDVKAKFEKRLSNSVDPDTHVLESIYEHLEYYEELAKRTLHTDLDEAIVSEVNSIRDEWRCYGDDLENIKEKFESFTPRLKMMEEQCAEGLYNDQDDDDDDRDAVSSKVIGVIEVYEELKKRVMSKHAFIGRVTSLVGMPGIGKTTLARKLLRDVTIVDHFDHCVWIRVGKNCRVKDIPRRILAEMDPDGLSTLPEGDEDAVNEYLKASLKRKKYLVVLDDVWDKYMAYLLDPYPRFSNYRLDHPFLTGESESRILLTSRLQQLGPGGKERHPDIMITMQLLKEKESWVLFCEKVFSGGPCPPQLEKAGKKISKNCEGLPLTIITVARLLSEVEKSTSEFWSELAENQNHPLFKEAYEEISKVLLSSYTYLSPLLQMCFLYMGVFPQKYKIPRSKLINLWLADQFDEINMNTYLNTRAVGYLLELAFNNLVVIYQKSISNVYKEVKTCGLHSSLWYLSNKKARETKFSLVLRSRDDGSGDGLKGQRRLSFHNNVLFAIKNVHKSVEDNCASTTRSLLCYGPYYPYQVPICFGLKLLTELDALLLNFYEFPVEVVQLVRLRYLALTMNGPIPASISQLSNLQFFIVNRHLNIKSHKDPSYLPMEIWGMKEIQHLQVMGTDLPNPCGASLESLSTLLNVSAHSCTLAVLNAVPNLKRLGIQIELTPEDYGGSKALSCLAHVSRLHELDSLRCVIVNPDIVPPIVRLSSFPTHLRKLTLSGLGYPWKEIGVIISLRHLDVLKLENYAFQGPLWKVEGEYHHISSIVIEDTDLVNWEVGHYSFSFLRFISIKHCYKLKNVGQLVKNTSMKIELVDCNPSFAEKLKNDILEKTARKCTIVGFCTLDVHSSWDEA